MKNILKTFTTIVTLSLISMFFFGINANAYIDPSLTTYLIQVIIGIVVAVGAVVGLYFRKAKSKVQKSLGIDENKNKELEVNDIVIDDGDEE